MTPGGWITMILSVGFVTVFFLWTLYRVLSGKRSLEDYHGVEPVEESEQDKY